MDGQATQPMFSGCLALMFGPLAPIFTRLLLASSKSLVMALAGLAMLCVLQTVFITAFNESFSLGALLSSFTVADGPLLKVGAAFWVSWLASASPGWRTVGFHSRGEMVVARDRVRERSADNEVVKKRVPQLAISFILNAITPRSSEALLVRIEAQLLAKLHLRSRGSKSGVTDSEHLIPAIH